MIHNIENIQIVANTKNIQVIANIENIQVVANTKNTQPNINIENIQVLANINNTQRNVNIKNVQVDTNIKNMQPNDNIEANLDNLLQRIKDIIDKHIDIIDENICERKSKIDGRSMLAYLFELCNSQNNSSINVVNQLSLKSYTSASSSAFIKKRCKLDPILLSQLQDDLINEYYEQNNNNKLLGRYRVLAVDGTHIQLSKALKKNDYILTKNNTYVDCLMTGLYDCCNNINIKFNMSNCKSEISQYRDMFYLLKPNDLVIHDRGYYNKQLLIDLHKKNVYTIFRLKKSSLFVKELVKEKIPEKTYLIDTFINDIPEQIKFRVVTYTIKEKSFFLGTTLNNEVDINKLKELYHDRWDIEEYFKSIKENTCFLRPHSNKEMLIKQETIMCNIISIITRLFEEIQKKQTPIKEYQQTNFKNNIKLTFTHITNNYIFVTKEQSLGQPYREVFKLYLSLLTKNLIRKRTNRTFPRRTIKPYRNWYGL